MAFELRGQTPQNATPVGYAASNFLRSFHNALGSLSGQSDNMLQPGEGARSGGVAPDNTPGLQAAEAEIQRNLQSGGGGQPKPTPQPSGPTGSVTPIIDGVRGSVNPIIEPMLPSGAARPIVDNLQGSVDPAFNRVGAPAPIAMLGQGGPGQVAEGARGSVNPIIDNHVMSASSPDGSVKGYLQPDGSVQFTYNDVPISQQGGDFVGFTPDGKIVFHDPTTGQARTEPVGGQPQPTPASPAAPAAPQPFAPAQLAAPAEPQVHPQTPLFTGQDNITQPPVGPAAPPAPPVANPSSAGLTADPGAVPLSDPSAPFQGGGYMPPAASPDNAPIPSFDTSGPTLSGGYNTPPIADIAPPVDYTDPNAKAPTSPSASSNS